jgi:hypothetical protein
MTFYEALNIFPEAKEYLKVQNKNILVYLKDSERVKKQCEDIIYRKCSREKEEFWRMIADVLIVKVDRVEHWKKILKRNQMALAPSKSRKGVTDEMIARAKQYPVEELIEFKRHVAKCPFHEERTSSLHFYKKDNKCHCFGGCNKSYDSIAIYQQLNNCSFVQAVERLQ